MNHKIEKMLKICSFLVLCVAASVHASGEFTVLHHPSSLTFKGHDRVRQSILKEVFSASLGFSIEEDSNWQGFYLIDPFNLPEAVVVVDVDGVADINQVKGHHFPLITDIEDNTFSALRRRMEERFPDGKGEIVNVDLENGLEGLQEYPLFRGIKSDKARKPSYGHLKLTVDEDRDFLQEITLLNAIADKIEQSSIKNDFVPDIYWFKVTALHALVDLHGENSTAAKEAKQLLNDVIIRLNNAFVRTYQGKVLVSVIVSDASHTRRTRSILAAKADAAAEDSGLNLAKSYNKDYPVIFNIILWFGIAMLFTLLAISIAIGDMDPGRDSIIYRMTSTRMKKDN